MRTLLSVVERQMVEEFLKVDNEIKAFHKQLTDYQNALLELNKIIEDIKNKKILKIVWPSLGNLGVQRNASDDDGMKRIKVQCTQIENAIKGIKGQITHRDDIYNEHMIKLAHITISLLETRGMNPKKTRLANFFKEEKSGEPMPLSKEGLKKSEEPHLVEQAEKLEEEIKQEET